MTTLLKDIYQREFLQTLGEKVKQVDVNFEVSAFVDKTLIEPWSTLTLKQRTRRIAQTLGEFLPESYEDALSILMTIAPDCHGFPYLFFPDFVVVYGTAPRDWECSMRALALFTRQSSSEFAIRTFILADPSRALAQLSQWSISDNEHLRRLASEGCRPRLPWGESLPLFKGDPTPILPILEQLKADPSLYVRRSVANNLNDIAKDHPEVVMILAKKWQGQTAETDWVIRHGCRTLLTKSFDDVSDLFGYASNLPQRPLVKQAMIGVKQTQVAIGDCVQMTYQLQLRAEQQLFIRVAYAVDYVKANGTQSRKLFKLLDKTVDGHQQISGSRMLKFKDLTTRKHYPGPHQISLIVNGQAVAKTVVEVIRRES